MSANDKLPFMPNKEELERLLATRLQAQFAELSPDAERFRYFGAAMMASICDAPTPQTATLMQILNLHKPRTLDELRTCTDAARVLTP